MSLNMSVVNGDQGIVGLVETEPWRVDLLHVSVHSVEDFTFSSSREKYAGLLPILYSHLADIESEARGSLVVDLGLVTFLDTSGLSFLIAAHKQLQALRAQLIVFSPSHRVRRLFDLTRLASYLTIVPD